MPATSRWTYNVVRPSCLNSPQTGWSSDRYRNFFAPRSTSRSDFRTRVQGLQDTPSADVLKPMYASLSSSSPASTTGAYPTNRPSMMGRSLRLPLLCYLQSGVNYHSARAYFNSRARHATAKGVVKSRSRVRE